MRTCDDFAPKLLVRDVYACDIAEWETEDKATFTFGETLKFTRVRIQASAHHAITLKASKQKRSQRQRQLLSVEQSDMFLLHTEAASILRRPRRSATPAPRIFNAACMHLQGHVSRCKADGTFAIDDGTGSIEVVGSDAVANTTLQCVTTPCDKLDMPALAEHAGGADSTASFGAEAGREPWRLRGGDWPLDAG